MKRKRRKIQHPTVSLDWAEMARLLDRGEMHIEEGEVVRDGGSHFSLHVEDGQLVDVLVEVMIEPRKMPVTCRLACHAGGPGRGYWSIPPVGAHVVIGVPRGEPETGCVILGFQSSESPPDGLAEDTDVIAVGPGRKLVVHDGSADDADRLVKLSEFNAFRQWVVSQMSATGGHTHTVSGSVTTAVQAVASNPLAAPAPGTPPAEPPGTDALKST